MDFSKAFRKTTCVSTPTQRRAVCYTPRRIFCGFSAGLFRRPSCGNGPLQARPCAAAKLDRPGDGRDSWSTVTQLLPRCLGLSPGTWGKGVISAERFHSIKVYWPNLPGVCFRCKCLKIVTFAPPSGSTSLRRPRSVPSRMLSRPPALHP